MGGRAAAPLLLTVVLGTGGLTDGRPPVGHTAAPASPIHSSPIGTWRPARHLLYRSGSRDPGLACRIDSAPAPIGDGYTEYVERFVAVVTRLMTSTGTLQRPDGFGMVGNLLFEAQPLSPEQFSKIMDALPFKNAGMAASIRARVTAGYVGVADFVDTRLGLQDKDAITFLGLSLIRPKLFRDDLLLENRLVHETLHLRYGHDEAKVCLEVGRLS